MLHFRYSLLLSFLVILVKTSLSGGVIIPTDSTQNDFLKTYKLVFNKSYVDYRFTNSTLDSILFPKYGEESIYWSISGANQGSFIIPDVVPSAYSSISSTPYTTYDWQGADHYSIQYKKHPQRIAVFRSNIKKNNNTVSWESIYFKNLFDSYIYNNTYYFISEEEIDTLGISGSTQLLIIPSFSLNGDDNKFYIDSIFSANPTLQTQFDAYLARGGMIYTEGNAVYFIEKLGYLEPGAVNFSHSVVPNSPNNLVNISFTSSTNPISFTKSAGGNNLYASSIPQVEVEGAEIIANLANEGYPAVFVLKGNKANGGRIACNLGLPTVGGINELSNGSRQLQWTMNGILYAFAKKIDVTRSLYNDLAATITAGPNAIAYDFVDTFEVRIQIRNLTSQPINEINITERIRNYFTFVDVVSPVNYTFSNNCIYLTGLAVEPKSEMQITYRLATPEPGDPVHKNVDNHISWRSYIYASVNYTSYIDDDGSHLFYKYRNYAEIMFSADIVADTDVNWKNFLGLEYQPFKVFTIMENKGRTSAEETKYIQYIPKDVPFYWINKSINIPILKTPGGKYVDVLKGSNNENNPEFDMDSDGHPDVWLDVNSIYPKGFTLEEDSVYWLNPWEHLISGNTDPVYEDIDHDGQVAQDTDGDGIVDIEEPGDKIRVWKVTWDINKFPGLQYFDPYSYYEIWVDPPKLVPLSAGVGYAHGLVPDSVNNMFYPYTESITNADLSDTTWSHWMERDTSENVIWKQLIYQSIHNYEGFTFVDTSTYTLLPTDSLIGTVPQPHREFIAVLSLGGEEIDMYHPTPSESLYSKAEYTTIFNEEKTTPIRTTYTYYAPLPNPLQFEYLTNNFLITDTLGEPQKYLPAWGKANLTFDIDASTEYTYYWIRNVGHDVDYNDPSEAIEGVEELGDGVFGYMIYDIPKGFGGYNITLPTNEDGSFDTDAIVEGYQKWIDNPNTGDSIEIWEDPFQYRIYIPQLLIPPAPDDDNHDGVDDWIDDRGDRFCSSTGFLHDRFMLDNGEDWLDYPIVPFQDDIYGMVDSGWYCGADSTYGDDFFENLGKTDFKIHAIYEGQGKEGPIQISKGGWLVVEEIFGGSPWVIFSHTLSGYGMGVDFMLTSEANPPVTKFGLDTIFIKHTIEDKNEPHDFNTDFDPYHVSFGYGESTITTFAGGKDPCSLIDPPINMSTIIDPEFDHTTVILIPDADTSNPDLSNFPMQVSGTFLEVKIEVSNGTDDNWFNTAITPNLSSELGTTHAVMSYVAYPRPLVPTKVDGDGNIVHTGDEIGSFITGWRFNQPEGEVLIKLGDTLNLMQPTRRAYFIILFSIDETLESGVYTIDFTISGEKINYSGISNGLIDYDIPSAQFSIADKNANGSVLEYSTLVIGTGSLEDLTINTTNYFKGLGNAKWSTLDINNTDFDSLTTCLPTIYNDSTGVEVINLSGFSDFPTTIVPKFNILEQGEVYNYFAGNEYNITLEEKLCYSYKETIDTLREEEIIVNTIGPQIRVDRKIDRINGNPVNPDEPIIINGDDDYDILTQIEVVNSGNDIADNLILDIFLGKHFYALEDSLPDFCNIINSTYIQSHMGMILPGETKLLDIHLKVKEGTCESTFDVFNLLNQINITYKGINYPTTFKYADSTFLSYPSYDFNLLDIDINKELVIPGSEITLIASIKNGSLPANNVWFRAFAIGDNQTLLVYEELIKKLEVHETREIIFEFIIPEGLYGENIIFYGKIDDINSFDEFCEHNNTFLGTVELAGIPWLHLSSHYPNPFAQEIRITYVIPRDEISSLTISFYRLDGVVIETLENCPISIGEHEIIWCPENIQSGPLFYKVIGINKKGRTLTYRRKIFKI